MAATAAAMVMAVEMPMALAASGCRAEVEGESEEWSRKGAEGGEFAYQGSVKL